MQLFVRLCFLAPSTILIVTLAAVLWRKRHEIDPAVETRVRYGFQVRNTGSSVLRGVVFSVQAPLPKTATQDLLAVDTAFPYESDEDGDGNRRLRISIGDIPPYGAKVIPIKTTLAVHKQPRQLPHSASFDPISLRTNRLPSVLDLVTKIGAREGFGLHGGQADKARAAHAWILANVKVVPSAATAADPTRVLNERSGSPIDVAHLLVEMLRTCSMPARITLGYHAEQGVVVGTDFLGVWAEALIGDRWLPVDPQRQDSLTHSNHYVGMRVLSNVGVDSRLQTLSEALYAPIPGTTITPM